MNKTNHRFYIQANNYCEILQLNEQLNCLLIFRVNHHQLGPALTQSQQYLP